MKILNVFFHNAFAGELIQHSSGQLAFKYDDSYCAANGSLPISVSMPLRQEAYEEEIARPYFSGLLPDDFARHRLARYLGVSEKNPFSLLKAVGGECAGALTLLPKDMVPPSPSSEDLEELDDPKLKDILELLKVRPLLVGADNVRLSLAGAQDKIAVFFKNRKIYLVHGMTPTTHILKPLIGDIEGSVHNEAFCMQLAASLGVETPNTIIQYIDDTPYLLIERYDRKEKANGEIYRLHQEDFCQAMSIMPELKYEREGGPSIQSSLNLISQYSVSPAKDQIHFLRRVIFNFLIGNADAHGKNFSFLYRSKLPTLSPAYDLLSTAVYPNLSQNMAMKIGGKYDPKRVLQRHWLKLVPDTKVAHKNLSKEITKMASKITEASDQIINEFKDKGLHEAILKNICKVIHARSEQIKLSF